MKEDDLLSDVAREEWIESRDPLTVGEIIGLRCGWRECARRGREDRDRLLGLWTQATDRLRASEGENEQLRGLLGGLVEEWDYRGSELGKKMSVARAALGGREPEGASLNEND